MAKKKQAIATERDYSIVREPIVTEKTTLGSEHSQVTFKVSMDATKPEIKKAIESLFSVKVKKVNTLVSKGKVKRFKGVLGKRNDYKKAIITLEDGQTIDTGIAL